ncbi:ATP-dependent DNA helicase RecG [Kyrpidia sp.]|uniref:ATP-dependent DNA helicase RecG n=1 Tax=Kyrpidia sp. TaxID=2073077 RepID=UPI002590AD1D|nr:ATP-dependent DNA helicase RecG [Kyrpidia sp.]MCL6575949.1 ATP-dependent DNA helicase RecG [Kyrpidia sp.]
MEKDPRASQDPLARPVTFLPGVGPRRARALESLGIRSIGDLLYHYPFRYEDLRLRRPGEWEDGRRVAVEGTVAGKPRVSRGGRVPAVAVPMDVQGIRIHAVWFRQAYVLERLTRYQRWRLVGRWQAARRSLVVEHMEPVSEGGPHHSAHAGRIVPVYQTSGDLHAKWLRTWIASALKEAEPHLVDPLPWRWRAKLGLMDKAEALREIHFPRDWERLGRARERLVYEECLRFQLPLQYARWRQKSRRAPALRLTRREWEAFLAALPFSPTEGQRRVLREVAEEIAGHAPMRRLILGDVGSGKTVIAAAVLFAAAMSGGQGVLLAPTEILAEQHARILSRWFAGFSFPVWLLTGGTGRAERTRYFADISAGRPGILVGTHAVLGDVPYSALRAAVCDEQQRFGVVQRMALLRPNESIHLLSMSATPIPRTLAMALFGDVDVSFLPARAETLGRRVTRWLPLDREEEVVLELRRRLSRGERAYVVAPAIGRPGEQPESKKDVLSLFDWFREQLAGFAVGLLHGRMSSGEKERVMRAFAEGAVQALVATTVVEVGVDVPEATMMVIYHAERFGLSQLHQLRGRIGRSGQDAVCFVLTGPLTDIARQRIEAFQAVNDGYLLAKKDLELRGPGEWAGLAQSGWPDFALFDPIRDEIWMRRAKHHAHHLVQSREFWLLPEFASLRAGLAPLAVGEGVH